MSKLSVVAVVPMKRLADCKLRLSAALDAPSRAQLALWMLERVLQAVQGCTCVGGTVVLGGDQPVQQLARAVGASWAADESPDLNGALNRFYAAKGQVGRDAVLYLAGDLPDLQPDDIRAMIAALDGGDVVLARGARGGTNAVLARTGRGFRYELGPNSFRNHSRQADAAGLRWLAYQSETVRFDVDLPSDLSRLQRQRPNPWESRSTA